MAEKLSWNEILKHYNQQWVELVDFEWDETEAFPTAGVVRVHSPDKGEMFRIASIDPPLKEAAILFVGNTRRKMSTLTLSKNGSSGFH